MATTGELRTIIEDLELVNIGDAASYLGEEATVVEESQVSEQTSSIYVNSIENPVGVSLAGNTSH
jgi:hypothetical protein